MFDDMAETVQNVGLAQSIQNGLAPSMQAKPKFGNPDAIAAKKAELTAAPTVLPLYQTPLGRYIINNWAAANGVQLGSERRASVQRKSISGDASLAYSGSAPTEATRTRHPGADLRVSRICRAAAQAAVHGRVVRSSDSR